MVALPFNGIFRIWEKICKNTWYNFFAIIPFALLTSSRFNIHVCFKLFCRTPIIKMPSLNRNEKVTGEKCVTQITKFDLARQKKSCSVGSCFVPNVPISPQIPKMI